MLQLETLLPAYTTGGQAHFHGWWMILAVAVFALVAPLAYLLGRTGGSRPG
jgi:hypothetical protein